MSNGDNDDSPSSRPLNSPRPTARDVPIAKYKEPSSAPRGLRGASLLPGQGAPERIVPEDIELAVLREADTLDSPHLARVSARRAPDLSSSPPPTPVSVEVPRVRSVPPNFEPQASTPTTPSARSVQSGTLMSVGSVDPRAPTELSLPSPRSLSQSERAAYLAPEAVVDRTPVTARPSVPALPTLPAGPASAAAEVAIAERAAPQSEPMAHSSARGLPGASAPASSARRSQKADSPAPAARHFGRPPQSYSPVSRTPEPPAPRSAGRVSQPPSVNDVPPQFLIHSQLDAVPHELEDNFDLRSVTTQREPLAGRRPMESADWTNVHEPVSARRDSPVPSERGSSRNPSSSSAITILVDSGRVSVAPAGRDSIPSLLPVVPKQAAVPVSWVLGAAAFALVLALLVAWVMRAPSTPETARAVDVHLPTERSAALQTALPSLQAALPAPKTQPRVDTRTQSSASPGESGAALKSSAPVQIQHTPEASASAGPVLRPTATATGHVANAPAPNATEAGAKPHQSIY